MKVAIVGAGKRTRDLAPFGTGWEVWVLGNHIDKYPEDKVSRIFEIHTKQQIETLFPEGYAEYLSNKNIPLIVGEEFPINDVHITIFPLQKALSLMGGHLTSSLSYMAAYAVMEGATHINFYGVDMDVDDNEYFYQRPAMYAWKGYAESKGIEVSAPQSSLFDDPLYPVWAKSQSSGPYTRDEFQRMADKHQLIINEAYEKMTHLQKIIDTHSGCKQVYDRLTKIARATDDGINIQSIEDSTSIKEQL